MTRFHRTMHPILWGLVLVVGLVVIALAWRARPADPPPSLPDAAAAITPSEEAG